MTAPVPPIPEPGDWQPSPPIPPLDPGIAHVWRLRVTSQEPARGVAFTAFPVLNDVDGATERLARHLTADERVRVRRFRQPADQARFASARGLLRELLGHYLARPPASVRLRATSSGKLEVDDEPAGREEGRAAERPADAVTPAGQRPPLRFNVSHSGDWVLIALARDGEVGVDVEAERPLSDLEALAARFFAPAEAAALARLTAEARERAFFRIWTRKEAYVKATGEGIAAGLDRFTVSHDDGAEVTLRIADDPTHAARWTLRSLGMPAGYAAAVAVSRPASAIRTWEWTA